MKTVLGVSLILSLAFITRKRKTVSKVTFHSDVRIGIIAVDSGTIFIGDPCYTATDDASHRIKTWSEWCDNSKWGEKPFDVNEPAGSGAGLSLPTMYGDGSYPVYAEVRNGRIAKVMISFDWDDEEVDE